MKRLTDFIKESSNLSSDNSILESCSYKNISTKPGIYERSVNDKIYFKENNVQKYFDALDKEFGHQYRLDKGFGGSIFFYKPKGQMSMKNLICMVSKNFYIDFGPNEDLVNTLGPKIMEVIDSVK